MSGVTHQALLMIGGGAVTCDPYFTNVVLLLGAEGTDASLVVKDESPLARGFATLTGNAQIDTAQFKYGTSSLLLDGTGDKISFADSADWDFDGQFTIECWIRINSFATATTSTIAGHGATSIAYGWWFTYSNAGLFRFRFDVGGDGTADHDLQHLSPAAVTGTWYHVAVDRDASNVMRLYVDGVMKASKVAATGTSFNSPGTLDIGYIGSSTTFTTNGWIDELRITKGVARYASDSGYTVPTAAFSRVDCTLGWRTAFAQTLTLTSASWNGYNIRQIIDGSRLGYSGSKVRVTLQAAPGSGFTIGHAAIGHAAVAGDAYDFDGTQIALTFGGGNAGVTVGANGTTLSDEMTYPVNNAKNLIVAVYFSAASQIAIANTITGTTPTYKLTADEVTTSDVSGYSTVGTATYLVNKVEVFTP